jgi:signal transduction histidine kinase/CheY-like chemotaxis protein
MSGRKEQGSRYFGATVVSILASAALALGLYLPSFLVSAGLDALVPTLLAILAALYLNVKLMLLADRIGYAKGDPRHYRAGTLLAISTMTIVLVIHAPLALVDGDFFSLWVWSGASAANILSVFVSLAVLKDRRRMPLAVSFPMFAFYTAASLVTGEGANYFLVYLVTLGIVTVFSNYNMALVFFVLTTVVVGAIVMGGAGTYGLAAPGGTSLFIGWGLAVYVSILVLMLAKFSTERNSRSALAEATLSSLMGSTPNLMVIVDGLNRITYISKPLATLAHIEEHEMAIGRPIIDLFPEMEMKLMISEIISSDAFFYHTIELRRDGERRHFKIISDRLSGETDGRFIDISDVTQIMEAKLEAEQSNAAKSIFLAKMSHEIRTPMNAIMGMTDLILRNELPPTAREYALEVKQAGRSLLVIINDILDITKIESGKMNVCEEEYGFASLLKDTVDITRFRAGNKGLLFAVNASPGIPSVMIGDAIRIRQILVNIINNAVKYTEEGHISFDADFRHEAGGLVSLLFKVTDTGIGIRKDDVKRLFSEFTQFDRARNRDIEGTGLGLSIARNLAQAMGGDISVASVYGSGSTFKTVIRQRVVDAGPFASVEAPGSKTVAVLEPRLFHRDCLAGTLKSLGVPCRTAGNLVEFADILNSGPCEFLLAGVSVYDDAIAILSDYGVSPCAVAVGEPGEPVPAGASALAYPVLPSSLANLLNRKALDSEFSSDGDMKVSFCSPSSSILVVDDILTNLQVAKGLLAPYEAEVILCRSGRESLKLVREKRFDMILMDHMMPEMDGIEVTAKIRAMDDGHLRSVPVIALTANTVYGMREVFLGAGFIDFLSKPIDLRQLDAVMEKWIPAWKKERPQEEGGTALDIPGIDVRAGLRAAGGSREEYIELLRLFYADCSVRLGHFDHPPTPERLPHFTTAMHALKSASATVGALRLSGMLRGLEEAGRAGSAEDAAHLLPAARLELHGLLRRLDGIIRSDADGAAAGPPSHRLDDSGRSMLMEIRGLVVGNDVVMADELLERMHGRDPDSPLLDSLARISYLIHLHETEKAVSAIDSVLGT